jgi:hypothetical protein
MYPIKNEKGYYVYDNQTNPIAFDASGRNRVGQLTTLADLKTLNADETLLIETVGDGTGSFANNKYSMTVAAGEYLVRASKQYYPYFSGKSQVVEMTFENFHSQALVVKRVGYFSSNAVAPFDETYDGFYLEDSGTTKFLVCKNAGVDTLRIAFTDLDNYELIADYDWSKFTVVQFDFLWLGGAILRFFLKTDNGFILIHTFNFSGNNSGLIFKSPNHKIRYEIRSTGAGVGSLIAVCSQVGTEGSINEAGKQRSVNIGHVGLSLATIGTTYPLLALRKSATHRDRTVKQIGLTNLVSSGNDYILISIQLNPTLSAALTYNSAGAGSYAEFAVGNGTITVTGAGTVLWTNYYVVNTQTPPSILELDYLSNIGMTLANVSDQLVICGTPVTATVVNYTSMNFKEY